MVDKNSTDSQDNVELPVELIQDLRAVVCTQVPVPAKVDGVVLAEARQHLRRVDVDSRQVRRSARWASGWFLSSAAAALAATVLIAIGLRSVRDARDATPETGMSQTVAREDLDRSGRVDILDAFMLSRLIEKGGPVDTAWDMNQDGRVNQDDVQLVAQSAVRLEPNG